MAKSKIEMLIIDKSKFTSSEYSMMELARLLGVSATFVAYNVHKLGFEVNREGKNNARLSREQCFEFVDKINSMKALKRERKKAGIYLNRLRNGHFADYYRPKEVCYLLNISEERLAKLTDRKVLRYELLFPKGKRDGSGYGGYSIEAVHEYARAHGIVMKEETEKKGGGYLHE